MSSYQDDERDVKTALLTAGFEEYSVAKAACVWDTKLDPTVKAFVDVTKRGFDLGFDYNVKRPDYIVFEDGKITLVECKSVSDGSYSKFSSDLDRLESSGVSYQLIIEDSNFGAAARLHNLSFRAKYQYPNGTILSKRAFISSLG